MDQESFRKLLQTPKAGASNTPTSRGSLLAATSSKSKLKKVDAAQPAFKPRTVKKKSQAAESYRDRAAERRLGLENDYAQVEALAEDFERKNADNIDREAVEEQRRYLGGDSTHSVLVKGLDFALLEQNRTRLSSSAAVEDDNALEEAFAEAKSTSDNQRKRTREEIVQALKAKRTKREDGPEDDKVAETKGILSGADVALDDAKKAGKFRPIGFKPIGGGEGEKAKKKKTKKVAGTGGKEKGERKKRPKIEADSGQSVVQRSAPESKVGPSSPPTLPPPQPETEAEPVDEDLDIFADAGEYTGVDLGDDDESEGELRDVEDEDRRQEEGLSIEPEPRPRWFDTEEEDKTREVSEKPEATLRAAVSAESEILPVPSSLEEGEEDEELPMRLQPLASSALPSIRELLELDSAVGQAGKRRARKEKNKEKKERGEGGGKTDKDKIERDYKRLKAYTDKKAAASGGAPS